MTTEEPIDRGSVEIADSNSASFIEEGIRLGRVTWLGPVTIVVSRTILLPVAQALVAAIYLVLGQVAPWAAAARWWTVYGTGVDLACLTLIAWFIRREGIGIRDLIGTIRLRRGHDVLAGLGWYLVAFPAFLAGSVLSAYLIYHSPGPRIPAGLLHDRVLPLWAIIFSLSLWWVVWSATEETTYNGYAFPRLEVLFGRSWMAIAFVGFWWAVQHCALPLILDWKYVLWRFGSFLPGVMVLLLIYRKTRRLAPLIVAHWLMDIAAAAMTIKYRG